jgi:hypothetical protein
LNRLVLIQNRGQSMNKYCWLRNSNCCKAANDWILILKTDTCTIGYKWTGSICKQCEKGTFQDKEQQTDCIKCPEGSTTDGTGKSSVSTCYGENRYLLFYTCRYNTLVEKTLDGCRLFKLIIVRKLLKSIKNIVLILIVLTNGDKGHN